MMRNYFQAERIKYRHTTMSVITFLMPLICVLLSAWLTHHYFLVDSYNWWYIGLYPGYVGILCGMLGRRDKNKKNYTICSLPCSMGKIWDAKILLGAVMSGISTIFIVILTILVGKGIETGLHMEFLVSPAVTVQILAGILMWLTALWEIPFCLFLVQKMGTFLTLVIHMGFYTIMAAIMSLKPWFPLFPGAITARLMCPVLEVMPNGLLLQAGQMGYSPQLAASWVLPVGILGSLIWFGILWAWSRRWFERKVVS